MAITKTKPDKYDKCIGCGCSVPDCISEYIFSSDEGTAKLGVVLCCNCLTNMYKDLDNGTETREHKIHN